MKNVKAACLTATVLISSLLPQITFADNSGSVMSQLIHNLTHAHHAFGGLMFLLVIVSVFKVKKVLVKKRIKK